MRKSSKPCIAKAQLPDRLPQPKAKTLPHLKQGLFIASLFFDIQDKLRTLPCDVFQPDILSPLLLPAPF